MYKIVLMLYVSTCVFSYTLKYYNCDTHKLTQRYSVASTCAKAKETESNETGSYDLLQSVGFSEVPGFSCQLRVSRFFIFCGSFSHNKLEQTPQIDLIESVSVEQCRKWVRSKRFKSADGTTHVLKYGETILSTTDLGTIHAKGSVSCEGQDLKINGEVIKESVILAQYRVTVLRQTF